MPGIAGRDGRGRRFTHLRLRTSLQPRLIRPRTAELRSLLQERRIPLQVVSGTENTLDGQMVERLQQGRLRPYGASHTVMLESLYAVLERVEERLFGLKQVWGKLLDPIPSLKGPMPESVPYLLG